MVYGSRDQGRIFSHQHSTSRNLNLAPNLDTAVYTVPGTAEVKYRNSSGIHAGPGTWPGLAKAVNRTDVQ